MEARMGEGTPLLLVLRQQFFDLRSGGFEITDDEFTHQNFSMRIWPLRGQKQQILSRFALCRAARPQDLVENHG